MGEVERIRRINEVNKMDAFERARDKYEKNRKAQKRDIKEAAKDCDAMSKPLKTSGVTVVINDPAGDFNFRFETPYLSGSRLASQRTREAYLQALKAFVEKEFGKCQLSQTP